MLLTVLCFNNSLAIIKTKEFQILHKVKYHNHIINITAPTTKQYFLRIFGRINTFWKWNSLYLQKGQIIRNAALRHYYGKPLPKKRKEKRTALQHYYIYRPRKHSCQPAIENDTSRKDSILNLMSSKIILPNSNHVSKVYIT